MERRIFLLAGALPIVAAFGALIVGLGLVVFGDNGSDTKATASTAEPTASAGEADVASYGIAWLGVGGGSTTSGRGVAITEVVDGSPADDAGIAVGDLILKFGGQDVNSIDDLARLVQQHEPGDEVTLSVIEGGGADQNGDPEDIEVTLGSRPSAANPGDNQTGGAWLGIEGTTADDGVEVTDVSSGGPADDADIEVGDVIVAVDGESMESFKALASLIRTHSPGDTVTITVEHDGDTNDVEVTLGDRPAIDLPDIGGLLPDIGGLLPNLDGFNFDQLIGGQLEYLDDDGNVVTISADAGDITSVSGDQITIHSPKGDDKTFDLPSDAHVPDNLAEGDNVVVISKDGEVAAVISTDLSKFFDGDGGWFGYGEDLPNGNFDFDSDFLPDGFAPQCTVDEHGVNCEIEIKPRDRSTDS